MEPDEDFFMNNDVYYNGVDLPMDTPAFPVAPSLGVATPQPALNHQSTGTFFPGAQYVRAELDEVQKANIGRKFGTADRRPIDPPPVVALRLFRVHNPGTSAQFEQEVCDYDAIAGLGPGLICMVDMFEVPGSCWDDDATRASTSREMFSSGGPTLSAYNHEVEVGLGPVYSDAVVGAAQVGQVQLCPIQDSNSPVARSYADISTGTAANSGSSDSEGVLHYHMGCYPITESSNQTQAIVGEKFVEPVVVDYQGLRMLMFAFPDLAVKRIGSFILRYRVFNLSLCMHPGTSSLVAELYGGAFRVYSTRDCPSLGPSTKLTKLLADQCPNAIRKVRRQARQRCRTNENNSELGESQSIKRARAWDEVQTFDGVLHG